MNFEFSLAVAGLESLKGEDAFRRSMSESFGALGFKWFTYASIDAEEIRTSNEAGTPTNLIYLSTIDPNWVAHYLEHGYAQIDPIVRTCAENRLPMVWNDKFQANRRSQNETQFMRDAVEFGVHKGLSIPIHGPRGEFGMVSLYSDAAEVEFERTANQYKFNALSVAYQYHDAIQKAFREQPSAPPPVPLTDRELEILKWTVAGKTAWEIGAILKISERTVNFHVQNVLEKFGVHNKTHAAAKAVNMGLIPR
jgi:LuxR family quorum-sensing transcriptional regulator LasR